jgi:ABC-type glycerol-3-phosphate transport system substrate-binding protein
MKSLVKNRIWALGAGAAMLAACGGGGGSSAPVDPVVSGTDIPVSATTSAAGAFTFVNSVASASDNTAEPLVVGDATLATSETDEPDASI